MKICKLCKRIFTREWNLKRHMHDVHRIANHGNRDNNVKQKIEENFPHASFNSNSSYEQKEFYNYPQSQRYPYSHANNFSVPPFYNEYNNIQSFPYSPNNSDITETRTLNNDDIIRIQKILKNLENSLNKVYHKAYVSWKIKELKDKCYREQSDEPLKKYLITRNMGYLWPD
ncbi:MAG TPA: hypothetical protein VHJ38_02400 [Nitrososphaeraceae archaeon]|nr:hypothetical protein [Nitrososphaeraceae archaeon]